MAGEGALDLAAGKGIESEAYSSRSATVTETVATASTVSSGRRSVRASGSAFSLNSSRAALVDTTLARSARARTSRARPPVTADSRTLASAIEGDPAAFQNRETALLSPKTGKSGNSLRRPKTGSCIRGGAARVTGRPRTRGSLAR